jgi:hypothetical protein
MAIIDFAVRPHTVTARCFQAAATGLTQPTWNKPLTGKDQEHAAYVAKLLAPVSNVQNLGVTANEDVVYRIKATHFTTPLHWASRELMAPRNYTGHARPQISTIEVWRADMASVVRHFSAGTMTYKQAGQPPAIHLIATAAATEAALQSTLDQSTKQRPYTVNMHPDERKIIQRIAASYGLLAADQQTGSINKLLQAIADNHLTIAQTPPSMGGEPYQRPKKPSRHATQDSQPSL